LDIFLERRIFTARSTIGWLTAGDFACWTLEDPVRVGGKIPGRTAIPSGTYGIEITWSPRFDRLMPILLGVPGFEGVRIHPGNIPEDTEGCILPGMDKSKDRVGRSRVAYMELYRLLMAEKRAGKSSRIVITEKRG
jgi:hypothetical protein